MPFYSVASLATGIDPSMRKPRRHRSDLLAQWW
jgi:hypothetical protein